MDLKTIDKNITKIRGLSKNLNSLIAVTAVAIVVHAFGTGEGQGSGDVSRATKLLKAMPNAMQRTYLIRWFRCAGIAINPGQDYAAKVVSKDSRDFRQPAERVSFAKANDWFDAVNKDGKRAPWYQGPTPQEQEPNTFLDFTDNIVGFADRTAKQLKEGKLRNSDKPLFTLSDEERDMAAHALGLVKEIGLALNASTSAEARIAEFQRIRDKAAAMVELVQTAPRIDETAEDADETDDTPVAATA